MLFISIIAGLVWFDNALSLSGTLSPGVVMMPLAFVGTFLCAGELVRLFEHDPHLPAPSRYVVVPGALATVVASAVPMLWHQLPGEGSIPAVVGRVGWVAIGLAIGSLGAFVIEMLRYKTPGSATMRLSLAIFGIAYAGGLMGFCVQLRMLAGGPWGIDGKWGMLALMSMMVVVKTNDIGAYCFGRLFGKNKLAPILSPGKTWEGVIGGFLFSTIATMITLGPVAEAYGCVTDRSNLAWFFGCLAYAWIVGSLGVAGDLAVSLLKRDAHLKNSSSWMPGFGGMLDILDSILFAAPAAYLLWLVRCVGPY